ncbi:MAG: response regulator transcription factor [Spirochaetia bacterium]
MSSAGIALTGSTINASLDHLLRQIKNSFDTAKLTPREQEVAFLLCERLSVGEIAQWLFVSRKTVAKHLEHIYLKLGVHGKRRLYEQLLSVNQVSGGFTEGVRTTAASSAAFSPMAFRTGELRRCFDAAELTPREQEVALLLCERLSVREIAEGLFISRKTVSKHLEHIYLKLGLHGKGRMYEQLIGESVRPSPGTHGICEIRAPYQVPTHAPLDHSSGRTASSLSSMRISSLPRAE